MVIGCLLIELGITVEMYMRIFERRRRPSEKDDERTPRPPYVKEPEPDVPDPDKEIDNFSRPVEANLWGLDGCA